MKHCYDNSRAAASVYCWNLKSRTNPGTHSLQVFCVRSLWEVCQRHIEIEPSININRHFSENVLLSTLLLWIHNVYIFLSKMQSIGNKCITYEAFPFIFHEYR